ncbi:MKI67 FHA domain-interacting nucleolar phosphoprotein [Heteronotia binoei]|uniref:MKI67 FHA domain-interacting nucleolar phosphoprotein n=1 Tax=Heteronotia binoei TaxID=13085 RepID=UPI00292EA12E|nr:MKI67 FHA domain-interacting nucleolar phosphoprotein [Heteronotia binoei]
MATAAAVISTPTPAATSLLSLDPERQKEFQAKVQRVKKTAAQKNETLTPGVIYLGHIPRGLYEPQLKAYFDQFGTVTRLRLSRSKKTGNSKGYGFVEFECDEVAKIVADTMNNYLFCERLLKCEFVPPEKVHENLFNGSERKFRKPSRPAVKRYNRQRSIADEAKMTRRLLKKERQLRRKLAAKGIDYDFDGFAAQISLKQKTLKKKKTPSKKKTLKKKKMPSNSDTSMDITDDSELPTPVCTPTLLERRKCLSEEAEENEIILRLPPASTKMNATRKAKRAKSQKKTAALEEQKCKTISIPLPQGP